MTGETQLQHVGSPGSPLFKDRSGSYYVQTTQGFEELTPGATYKIRRGVHVFCDANFHVYEGREKVVRGRRIFSNPELGDFNLGPGMSWSDKATILAIPILLLGSIGVFVYSTFRDSNPSQAAPTLPVPTPTAACPALSELNIPLDATFAAAWHQYLTPMSDSPAKQGMMDALRSIYEQLSENTTQLAAEMSEKGFTSIYEFLDNMSLEWYLQREGAYDKICNPTINEQSILPLEFIIRHFPDLTGDGRADGTDFALGLGIFGAGLIGYMNIKNMGLAATLENELNTGRHILLEYKNMFTAPIRVARELYGRLSGATPSSHAAVSGHSYSTA